jgi:putative nucleotidyltransferase with HDIG domain
LRIKNRQNGLFSDFKLMIVDDDEGLLDSISVFIRRSGYDISAFANPVEGLYELKKEKYDLLILDYFMPPIKGDDFVAKLREFDADLYVILLTGHKDLAPPLTTIRALDIQAYCEKSTRLDQLLLLIESGIKSINQMKNIKKQAEELEAAYSALKTSYVETIEALRLAVDTKDEYTRGHSDRVSMYARLIGERLGMDRDDMENLRIGGLFHDIGKIGTSEKVLLKTSKLTDEEFEEIKKHSTKGAMILSAISAFAKIKDIVESHHERIDGRGYPKGLQGPDIPFEAKIICVADAYDAMMSDRQYRTKLAQKDALAQLYEGRGTQFDTAAVDCFLSIIEENSEEIQNITNYI